MLLPSCTRWQCADLITLFTGNKKVKRVVFDNGKKQNFDISDDANIC
jgi:hypothetical protein